MEYDINAILEMYEDDYNPDPRPMNQGPRNMYNQGSSVDHAVRTIDPVQDSGNKIEEVLKAYGIYQGNRKSGRMSFKKFFELFATENFAEGGRTGFEDGMRVMEDKLISNYRTKLLKELDAGKKPSEIQSFEDYKKTQTEVDMNPGKKKLYEALDNATKIRLAKIGCPGKANGGRIGFNEGQNLVACATRGVEKLQGDPGKLSPGDKSNLRALTKSGKALKFLKGVLGPGAILGELVLEGGIAANKTLNEGVPFKTAFADSIFNMALGPKLKIDKEAELKKEFAKGEDYAMAERGRRMIIPQSATADKQRLKKRYEQMNEAVPTYSSQQIDKMLLDNNITREDMGMNDNQINEYIKNQRVADAGGVSNLAEGGIADLMKKKND